MKRPSRPRRRAKPQGGSARKRSSEQQPNLAKLLDFDPVVVKHPFLQGANFEKAWWEFKTLWIKGGGDWFDRFAGRVSKVFDPEIFTIQLKVKFMAPNWPFDLPFGAPRPGRKRDYRILERDSQILELREKGHLTFGQIAKQIYNDSKKASAARSACERLKNLRKKRYGAYLMLKDRCRRLGLLLDEATETTL